MAKEQASDKERKQFPFPKNENGVELDIFLVTVKNIVEKNSDNIFRFVIFANTGSEAHQKIVDHYDNCEFGQAAFRISVEHAHIVSGSKGIIQL